MARPIDPTAQYRVSIHNIGGYRYASTQPAYQDPETGKTKHRYIHWGKLDDSNKFIPGSKYIFASIDERSKLIFRYCSRGGRTKRRHARNIRRVEGI